MKNYIFIALLLILGCKNKSSLKNLNEASEGIPSNENTQKPDISYANLADSLYHFSLSPINFKEYHMDSEANVKNRKYMQKVIKNCNRDFIPYLVEKIIDTTTTEIDYADIMKLRVGDVALELIEISDKDLTIPSVLFKEFNDSDLSGLDKLRENGVYTMGNVYIPLLFKAPNFKHVHFKNRKRIYLGLKKRYNLETGKN